MSIRELTPLEAFDQLGRYRIVDVREEHEFHGPLGFVESAELVPLSTVANRAKELNGPQPLLLVCRSGKRSGKACAELLKLGIEDVTNLSGGMIDWNLAGLPVLHTEPDTLSALVTQIVLWAAQVGPLSTETLHGIARDRLGGEDVSNDAASHAAVDEFIGFIGESMQTVDPPDLELSLASFRRSLALL